MTNNHSFASSTVSNNDDFSSSYESHSDYDMHKKHHQQQQKQKEQEKLQQQASKKQNQSKSNAAGSTSVGSKSPLMPKNSIVAAMQSGGGKLGGKTTTPTNGNTNPNTQTNANNSNNNCKDDMSSVSSQVLKPRPESLAVMTNDQFAEKCNAKQSSNSNLATTTATAGNLPSQPSPQPSNFSVSMTMMQSDKKNLIEQTTTEAADHVSSNNKQPIDEKIPSTRIK